MITLAHHLYTVNLTFTEPLLGTAPLNDDIYDAYIRTREPSGDPAETADESATISNGDKGKTGFHRLPDGTPILYDYTIRGYFKEACASLARAGGLSKRLKAYKKTIDGAVFIEPRQIPIRTTGPITELQRPLRAQTMQGERIALACSEMIPAHSAITFQILILGEDTIALPLLTEWLDYGQLRGLGQWRNASYGRFTYTLTQEEI